MCFCILLWRHYMSVCDVAQEITLERKFDCIAAQALWAENADWQRNSYDKSDSLSPS
jgi:hypothetical protein